MKTFKRITVILLVAIMVVSFVACRHATGGRAGESHTITAGDLASSGIKIDSTTYEKTSEIYVVASNTTGYFAMSDDSSWSTYYSGSYDFIKGVFVNGRKVTLSPFIMSQYEVTQELYEAVMGSNPSKFSTQNLLPVEHVSWYSAIVFCNKLSMLQGLEPCYTISDTTNPNEWGGVPTSTNETWDAVTVDITKKGYRLPTEA